MVSESARPIHPGAFIRSHIIPKGVSVTQAAKRLGIGRPALSNLLNGKANLSPEMAARLEATFGAERQKLIELQAAYDGHKSTDGDQPAAGAYVPSLTVIKARQLEEWATKDIEARTHLAVLLRTLVNSTGRELRRVDFPAYDNAERKGWDGSVEAHAASPWVPVGLSGWEFGVTADPKIKADGDYAARTGSIPPTERAEMTFVFATPRNWPKKNDWEKAKNATGQWKAVRAYDASDLEQWLEQSATAQIWMAARLGIHADGYRTLDQCWTEWSLASEPPLAPELLSPSVTSHASSFKNWLAASPDRPFIVAADSRNEGLAFLACLFSNFEVASVRSADTVLTIDRPEAAKKLETASSGSVVLVAHTTEVEKEFGPLYRRFHCIVVRPRNAVDSDPEIALDVLRHEDFERALAAMKIQGDAVDRLARESARSPTILRRRLSKIDAIKVPHWARDAAHAARLVPAALIGAWHAGSKADCEVIALLEGGDYQKVERDVAHLLQFDDTPVWSVGQFRGVTSKIDSLFAIARYVSVEDLENFLVAAEYVLSEVDPALELPEDKRPFAGLYGKVREHSAALRNGICETLVLLAVHGNNLFRNSLGIDLETRVVLLVRKLLTPLTLEKLLSHDRDLPNYAEAAPEEFLRIIKNDLESKRVVFELLTPADTGIFGGGCPRTGLLWALEGLAWRAQNMPRVTDILAQLSTKKIDDNWTNKPENSLQSIFRSWMPQTAATVEQRIKTLETIAKKYPDIGWAICVEQFDSGSRTGSPNYRPRWRSDASGAGQPVTLREDAQFIRRCVEIALAWPTHSERTLGDLVERLQSLSEEHQTAVWAMIDAWAVACSDEDKKAQLRDRIRRYAFTRRSRTRGITKENAARARQSSAKLSPADPVIRHEWLFRAQWVEESAEETEHHDFDYRLREQRVYEKRISALREIWQRRKFEGIAELLHRSGAAHIIGSIMADLIKGSRPKLDFVKSCIAGATGEHAQKYENCLKGFLLKAPDAKGALHAAIETTLGRDGLTTLYLCMPFGSATWQDVEKKGLRQEYWSQVSTHWNNHDPDEANELIDRLIEVKRPLAAFHAVNFDWTKVETSRLTKLLHFVATTATETPPSYKLRDYEVSEAFKALDKRAGISTEEKSQLEFRYLEALDHGEHGIPNLEKQIATSPAMFVQAVIFTFKRNDGGTDPAEFVIQDPERRTAVAGATYRLLNRVRRVPGTDENGVINLIELKAWLTDVRAQLKKFGRAEIGDQCIGQVFSRTPVRDGSAWPDRTICEAMEWMSSDEVGRGFHIGTRNSRGAHWRGQDGSQEREMAARYRKWSHELAFDLPHVASVLESIAASYDREAQWEDTDARIRKRLPYG